MIKKMNMGYFNPYKNTSNNSRQRLKMKKFQYLKCFVILLGIIIVILMICFGHKVFSCFSLHQTHEVGFLIMADADDSESVRIKGGDLRDLTVNEAKIFGKNLHCFNRNQLEYIASLNMQPLIDHYVRTLFNLEFFGREHLECLIYDYKSADFNNYLEFKRFMSRHSIDELKYNILYKDFMYLLKETLTVFRDLEKVDRSLLEALINYYCRLYIRHNGKFFDYGDDKCANEIEEILKGGLCFGSK